jgi:hypothetical protein
MTQHVVMTAKPMTTSWMTQHVVMTAKPMTTSWMTLREAVIEHSSSSPKVSSRSVYLPYEKTSHPLRHCARITFDFMLHWRIFLVEE